LADEGELAGFVREHVRSVWALELLLVLKRDPTRAWPPDALTAELRASQSLVVDNLQRFERSGLAIREEDLGWRYAPASPLIGGLADRLEQAYRERPVSIINLIAAPPDPVQGLADAFKFRGEK
jgi:hypothetical protein